MAFPGAEGFGRFAAGGRGGVVYHVTNLNDSGPGSFRDAVSQPKRIVVFDVAGVIKINSRVQVSPNLTIAGQTAPGDGISIYGNGVSFSKANNTIARYLRIRMGVNGEKGADAVTISEGSSMIFDHLSVSWGRDETFSVSGTVSDVTIQNSIIAEGLHSHSAGGLIQTTGGISLLRNLYVNNHTRNPKVKGKNQYINNVIYNWRVGGYILGDSESNSYANVLNNYFIDGPQTSSSPFSRGNTNFHIFAASNFHDGNRNGKLDGADIPKEKYTVVDWLSTAHDYPKVTMLEPQKAYEFVIANSGASLRRDQVDTRLVNTVKSLGKEGKIISSEEENPEKGPGILKIGKSLNDADKDGMPDVWEKKNKLNPKKADDKDDADKDGFTNIEEYINEIVRN
ncbi:MAG: pectate lyase [Sphingobacteriaceae bacterium]|nr:pectate lyase [Sphingobacteriaceae bacterium]